MRVIGPDFTILRANRTFLEMVGLPEEQVVGRKCHEVLSSEFCGTTDCPVTRILGGEKRVEDEIEKQRADGSRFPCMLASTPLQDESGRVVGVVEDIKDITERRQLEEQLFQAQKMEAIGRLAGGVAHDFNNLMTVITGYADRLLRRMSPDDPSRKEIESIRKSGEQAVALTRQLLAFGRKQVLQPRVLDLNALIREYAAMLPRLLGEDIDVTLELDSGLGRIKADPVQIQQVLMNLAVNARDAMPDGGGLTVETANTELPPAGRTSYVAPAGHYVMLAVRDTGCGMDVQTRERIFEPFFTTKEVGTGSGLGLSTVYGIVRQSGGDIRVYSTPGQGTSFIVYLPRVEEPLPEQKEPRPSESEVEHGSETILLVEDEKSLRELAKIELEELGYSVLEAGSVGEGLAVSEAHEGTIHLLLTDVVLPGLSGSRLREILERRRPDIKVLYISGHTERHVVRHGVLEPGIPFLEKPFTFEGLAAKIREVLDSPARE
jgi:PAS domain S-box-containing protein